MSYVEELTKHVEEHNAFNEKLQGRLEHLHHFLLKIDDQTAFEEILVLVFEVLIQPLYPNRNKITKDNEGKFVLDNTILDAPSIILELLCYSNLNIAKVSTLNLIFTALIMLFQTLPPNLLAERLDAWDEMVRKSK